MASDLMEDIAPGLHCYIKKNETVEETI